MMAGRHLVIPPRDPAAEPVCLLTREWAARREVPVDALLASATQEILRDDGIEYHLTAGPGTWAQVEVFIEEEGECCPFLAFEAEEKEDIVVLRVLQLPREDSK